MIRVLFFVFLFLISCSHGIEYIDDAGFPVSGAYGSPEAYVYVDGYQCLDIAGKPGLCSIRIDSLKDLVIHLDPRQYDYRLSLVCTDAVGVDQTVDVPKDQSYSYKIDHIKYKNLSSFTCIGEIFPQDRHDKLSVEFNVRVKVIPNKYASREKIRVFRDGDKYYLVLGKHALYSAIKVGNNDWEYYKKKTIVEVEQIENITAYSESYNMRVNYFQN